MASKVNVKPFLKWAGGKNQIAKCIEKHLPHTIESKVIDSYFEPFLGGGAIFFHLINNDFTIKDVYLSDINKDLILTYNVVKCNPHPLISKLKEYSNKFPKDKEKRKDYYYDIRTEFNEDFDNFDIKRHSNDQIIRAAQMIFLNRTCFNGLYRVNKSGKFNVPIGSYKNPLICDETNILKVSDVLQGVNIECKDYSEILDDVQEDSFVYLDPPYFPINKTSFTSYTSGDFGKDEQIELSHFCKKIDDKNAKFLLSNSNPPIDFFNKTYNGLDLKKCNHKKIDARRSINSNGKKRGAVKELLIFNY